MWKLPKENIFTPRVAKRGENKFSGGNVLQLRVEEWQLGDWLVRFSVGASMKAPVYKCFCVLNKTEGVLKQVCECKNG